MKSIMNKFGILALGLLTALSVQAQTKKLDITPESGMDVNKLIVKGALSINIIQGEESKIWLEYDEEEEDQMPKEKVNVNYKAESNTLKLDHAMFSGYPGKIFLQTSQLEYIKMAGAIDLNNSDTIRSPKLSVVAEGASDIKLLLDVDLLSTNLSGASAVKYAGTAVTHKIKTSGAADVHARRLFTKDLRADISGFSNVNVLVSNSIKGSVSGMSNLVNHSKAKINEVETSGVSNASSNSDTTQFRFGKSKIIITDSDLKMKMDEDFDDEMDEEKKEEEFDGHWGGFELGFNGFVNADNKMELPQEYEFLKLREEKSILVNLNLFEQNINLIRNHVGFVTGLGLQYNNYRFANNVILDNDGDKLAGDYDKDTDRNYIKSKLVANYLTVPLILEFTTHGKNEFHIGAGAQFAWKIGEHSKIVYEKGTNRQKEKDRGDFYLNPYKLELTGRIGWGWINLFATYSLNEMFEDGKGPEMYPFTAGVTLIGW
ncbi:MAG: GIN domain-containing protein [Bacteroidales bacterium]